MSNFLAQFSKLTGGKGAKATFPAGDGVTACIAFGSPKEWDKPGILTAVKETPAVKVTAKRKGAEGRATVNESKVMPGPVAVTLLESFLD